MCTAITFQADDHYFGRNLDLEYSYGESVTITPRNYPFRFRHKDTLFTHYAFIGMAIVEDGYPLYFDATNECGLSMAGLNFPGNAVYQSFQTDKDNITPFELIPWILSQCSSVEEAVEMLKKISLLDEPFNDQFQLTPLHWIIADTTQCIVAEPLEDGLKVYDNPVGVLANNPPFDYHLHNLRNYLNLTPQEPQNRFSRGLELTPFSRGMGAMGLPGDFSSPSRFVRAAFVKWNARQLASYEENVGQFFHILQSVAQPDGCTVTPVGFEKTIYSSCCNTSKLIYYYTTYENQQISAVQLMPEHLELNTIRTYPLLTKQQIYWHN